MLFAHGGCFAKEILSNLLMNASIHKKLRQYFMALLVFHQPEICTVGGQKTSAAKIMSFSGDQIHCSSASGIKMSHEIRSIRIDSHHDSLMLRLSFENALLIGQQY